MFFCVSFCRSDCLFACVSLYRTFCLLIITMMFVKVGMLAPDPEGVQGLKTLFYNRRGLIISYNFIRKVEIGNAINNC